MEDKLTLELLKEVKANARKWFVIAIIELGVILAIIVSWFLMSYVIPVEDTTTTNTEQIEQDDQVAHEEKDDEAERVHATKRFCAG